jgi:hypothetical protein
LQNDPIGFRDVHSFNRYAYGNNNPYKFTDPDGRASTDAQALRTQGIEGGAVNNTMMAQGETIAATLDVASDVVMPLKGIAKQGVKQTVKGKCCFVAGTQVLTENGYKNIEDVLLGEKLWAKNVETGEQDWKPVTRIFIEPDRGIYTINLQSTDGFKQKIEATDDHPFYVIGKGWRTTIELIAGDHIETDGNGPMVVTTVIDQKRQDLTYNFTVADFHTYYVTKRNVLVHNCDIEMKTGGIGESTTGSFDKVKETINKIANSGDQAAIKCAQCKLTKSLKTRRTDQKQQVNKNNKSYQEHKKRINMEQEGLDKLNRNSK